MSSTTVVIGSQVGLHARPASVFTHAVAQCGITVMLTDAAGSTINAGSILGVLAMGIGYGDVITLSSDDEAAESVLASLAELLERELDRP
ncbi:HPr family phosphocarrier protein [Salinibacterium sp. NSLL150]|uniref:HPr family phosphocarrier protein n=1 Tax=unclassified Salinibacterium TaxID=2632331 RepID=UPI0018CE8172|nr:MULTISPECIES: HPr family phosphocarrier protein [unclassified Salinibacterium]MBH0099100.1 HPr family phosphocarrier protein [Salinibacterium sp. NSLL35]MBH0101854.1 HPr family phosphocarrier protein [Salinibacterium sp. NSLL150]MBH0104614.1 HPr family phosphocarrier protein [Salinibacterium sp. NSLL16]MBH0107374.1 HPr family phosphocarrier protein [Salinibacterium sp. NSLL17]